MSFVQILEELVQQVFTKETVILLCPWFIASVFTSIIVHVIRIDNRKRNKPPFLPLTLLGIIAGVGFVIGFLSQFFLHAFIEWAIPTLPIFGIPAYMGAGFFTPLGAWLVHKSAIIAGGKGWLLTPEFAYKLKVKHVPGVHNTGSVGGKEMPSETELFYLDQKKGKANETKPV